MGFVPETPKQPHNNVLMLLLIIVIVLLTSYRYVDDPSLDSAIILMDAIIMLAGHAKWRKEKQ